MVGAAGSIRRAAKGKDNDTDRTTSRSENAVVRGRDTVGIVHQVLRILQRLRAQARIDVDCDAPAGAGSNKLRRALITGPRRRGWVITFDIEWLFRSVGSFDTVIHSRNSFSNEVKSGTAHPVLHVQERVRI